VKQHTGEQSTGPLSISVYPGQYGSFLLYEDDGKSFDYRKGEWMGIEMHWNDSRRVLTLRLAAGSKMLPPLSRDIEVTMNETRRTLEFTGKPVELQL
jgi:alpha-glucosidase (family GH31 glycosyl hydrolase)